MLGRGRVNTKFLQELEEIVYDPIFIGKNFCKQLMIIL